MFLRSENWQMQAIWILAFARMTKEVNFDRVGVGAGF